MAGVQNRQVVPLRQGVHRVHQREEVFLRVDVLLPVGGEQDVLPLLQSQPLVDIGGFDLLQIGVEHLRHGGTGNIGALLGQPAFVEVAPGVLGISKVHIRDDVHDPPVGLLRQTLVLAAVACLHVEDGDVEPLGSDGAEAGVGIPQDQQGIRLLFDHNTITFGYNIADRLSQVRAYGIQIEVRRPKTQVIKEHLIELVVIVLAGVDKDLIKVAVTLFDDNGEPDDLRPGSDDSHEFQPGHGLNLLKVGVGMPGIKGLVGPHKGDKVLCLGKVDDVVGIPRQHVHRLNIFPRNPELQHFAGADLSLLDEGPTGDYHEKLPFAMVPVLALSDAGFGDVHTELAAAGGAQQLREASPLVRVHL